MAIEVNAASSICRKCGTAYSRLKGYFPVSYSYLFFTTTRNKGRNNCIKKQ